MINKEQREKLLKLKRMRLIATGLLILMAVVYLVFKRFEDNLFLSSVTAFAEAAMIGALADWFAVVALFRHPLGMTWIPHTAIIQKNKDRIGESLANFVVSNFFTEELIKSKLQNITFMENILSYVKEHKEVLAEKAVLYFPVMIQPLANSEQLADTICLELKKKLRETELTSLINSILPGLISAELHVPMVKQLLESAHHWVGDHKEKTLKMIEGINKTFSLPFVGDIVYNSIVKTLGKLVEDMENDVPTEFNREILHKLPVRLVKDFQTSTALREKVEKLKDDALDSELFNRLLWEKISDIREAILSYSQNSREELGSKLPGIVDNICDSLLNDASIRESLNTLISESIAAIICNYRHEIAGLISDTVKEWPMDDMVDKLETQVGGDLQYIRINGTVIGGLAGVAIHLLSHLL